MHKPRVNADAVHDLSRPTDKLACELYALARTFVPHGENSAERKIVTLVFFLAWAIIAVGVAFGWAEPTEFHVLFTAIVFMIIGRMWGLEIDILGDLGPREGRVVDVVTDDDPDQDDEGDE